MAGVPPFAADLPPVHPIDAPGRLRAPGLEIPMASTAKKTARPRSRRHRLPGLPDDPFVKTKLDYAFNLVAAGVLRPGKHQLGDVNVVVELLGGTAKGSLSHETAARRLRSLVAGGRGQRVPHAPASPAAENLATLAQMLQLDEAARDILAFILACHDVDMQDLLEPLGCANGRELFIAVAGATGHNVRDVGAALHSRGRLRKSGLCTLRHHGEVYERLELDSRLADLLTVERLSPDAVMERFLPAAAPPSLSLED
jgi:hypothetical protein